MSGLPDPFVLEVLALGAPAEAYLNGIPVVRTLPPPGNPRSGTTINPLIRDGRNLLEVVVGTCERPSLTRVTDGVRGDAGISVRARVSRYVRGAVIGEAPPLEVLGEVSFEGDGGPRAFPLVLSNEFVVASPFPRWRWERADPLRLDAHTTAEAIAFLADYHLALSHRDLARENAMTALLHAEICVAFGSDPRQRLAEINGVLSELWRREDWAMEPIDVPSLDLRLCADDRLVQCVTRSWDDPIQTNADADGGRLSVSMMLGRVDGRLQWLR